MKIDVKLTVKNNAYIIKNLYPLFLYDISEYYSNIPNVHGIHEKSDNYRTLNDQYEVRNI